MNIEQEIWKDIQGYEGLYQVSNLGNVKSLWGRYESVDELKPFLRNGYRSVGLCKDKHQRKFKINRLVAQAFIPNPYNKPQVNHIDGNKLNDNVRNLEWCTQSENQLHAYRTGLQKVNVEAAHKASKKLTKTQVCQIRCMLKKGISTRKIAKFFNVGKTLISNINQNKAYPNIGMISQ